MPKDEPKIICPTFQKQEPIIKELTNNINNAKGVEGKARVSEELKKETDVLLNCPDYNKEKLDCKNCRFITNLRKKTANLIIKAKRLTK